MSTESWCPHAEVCQLCVPELVSRKQCLTRAGALVLGVECREAAAAWRVAPSRVFFVGFFSGAVRCTMK